MNRLRKMPQKLPAPGRGQGRVQLAAERVGRVAGSGLISTSQVMAVAYARRTLLRGLSLRPCDYRRAWRALERIAVRVRRSPTGSGRAWLWRLRSAKPLPGSHFHSAPQELADAAREGGPNGGPKG